MKRNERDDKWFLEFPSEMIEGGSVVIVNMCEAREVCKCKDVSVYNETKRVIVVLGGHFGFLGSCIKECEVNKWANSFASARPAPQPCVSVHRCGIFENRYVFIYSVSDEFVNENRLQFFERWIKGK